MHSFEGIEFHSGNSDFGLITNWIPDNSLGNVRSEVKDIREKYYNFMKSIDKEIRGIHTTYEILDSDFGAEKWLVTFEELYDKEEFTEEIKY